MKSGRNLASMVVKIVKPVTKNKITAVKQDQLTIKTSNADCFYNKNKKKTSVSAKNLQQCLFQDGIKQSIYTIYLFLINFQTITTLAETNSVIKYSLT